MADLISVIVTTYERPDALAAVLRGLQAQRDRRFEIVIADDGSAAATRDLIGRFRSETDLAVSHVWHPQDGFRAAEIRNRAVAGSHGALLIFLDGDCIPRPDFVARHRALAEPGWFVAGNRILLNEHLTARVLRDGLRAEQWGAVTLLRHRLAGGVNRLAPAASLPDGAWRKRLAAEWEGVRSANVAVWRKDIHAVDGFDSDFHGWGLEDSDLVMRLMHAGVRRKDGRFATGVLHLWHPFAPRTALTGNQQKLDATKESGRMRALRGLSALSPPQDAAGKRAAR